MADSVFAALTFTGTSTDNTASPNDYDGASQSMNLPTSTIIQMKSVTIVNDACYETSETFNVGLMVTGTGCVLAGTPSTSQITITDDDCKHLGYHILSLKYVHTLFAKDLKSIPHATKTGSSWTKQHEYTFN